MNVIDKGFVLEQGRLDISTEIDSYIFAEVKDSILDASLQQQSEITQRLVAAQYRNYLAHCRQYAAFASKLGVADTEALNINHIPVIPTSAFKRTEILSSSRDDVAKWCRSSGTTGTQSVIARDRLTLERLLGSIRLGMGLIGDWYEHEVKVINLGPRQEEAGDIWISYVMSLVELLFDTTSTMSVVEAIAELEQALTEFPHVFLIGPPFLVNSLLDRLAEQDKTINGREALHVVTAGGWKKHSGAMISRQELQKKMQRHLGMADISQYRDCFNQVELNTVFFECAQHKKHVPAWVHAVTRHPENLQAQADGEIGLLSFLDASACSYPCFLVGDDVGVVRRGQCECGREGVTVEILRRVEGRSVRGCALAIEAKSVGQNQS